MRKKTIEELEDQLSKLEALLRDYQAAVKQGALTAETALAWERKTIRPIRRQLAIERADWTAAEGVTAFYKQIQDEWTIEESVCWARGELETTLPCQGNEAAAGMWRKELAFEILRRCFYFVGAASAVDADGLKFGDDASSLFKKTLGQLNKLVPAHLEQKFRLFEARFETERMRKSGADRRANKLGNARFDRKGKGAITARK